MSRAPISHLAPDPEVGYPTDAWIVTPTCPARRIVVPGIPPSWNQLLGVVPGALHRLQRTWLDHVADAVGWSRDQGLWDGEAWPPGLVRIIFGLEGRQGNRDLDNISLKWVLDGLRRGGVLHDDSLRYVRGLRISARRAYGPQWTVVEWVDREAIPHGLDAGGDAR